MTWRPPSRSLVLVRDDGRGGLRRGQRGYRNLMRSTPAMPPPIWAAMNTGTDDGRDAREAVGEHPADGDRWVGEAGGGGEPVGGADVGADRRRAPLAARPDRASAKITSSSPAVAITSDSACAPDARCLTEMDTAARANIRLAATAPVTQPGDLGRQVGGGVPPRHAAQGGVGERDDRVEVRAGHRPEHQDDREQPGRGRGRVLQQLQPGDRPATAAGRRCRSRSRSRRGTRCRGTPRRAAAPRDGALVTAPS